MISVLCNPGLRMRHWDQMSVIAKFDFSPDSSTTLRKMLRLNLIPYMDQFEIISGSATKVKDILLKFLFFENVRALITYFKYMLSTPVQLLPLYKITSSLIGH